MAAPASPETIRVIAFNFFNDTILDLEYLELGEYVNDPGGHGPGLRRLDRLNRSLPRAPISVAGLSVGNNYVSGRVVSANAGPRKQGRE